MSSVSARIWLSIGDVSVASAPPRALSYTNICIEITLYPFFLMSSRIWLFICDVSVASVSPCSPVRPYTYFHRNNVVAAVPSVSARILLSIGDVSVASISPCVREYTDIYIEITL